MDQSIQKEIFELEPSTIITLYQIVLLGHNASYYFHSGENGFNESIKFKNQEYYHIPIKAEGFDYSDSKLARPTLTADNTDSFFSLKAKFFNDFIGFPVKRIRTFVKFLHGDNFPGFEGLNNNPFGTATELSFPTESYIINKKNTETQNLIQFELCSPLERENAFIPNRKVVFNVCQWKYRDGVGCGYNGPPKSDAKGNPINANNPNNISEYSASTTYSIGDAVKIKALPDTRDVDKVYVCTANNTTNVNPPTDPSKWTLDACPKTLKACHDRFGKNEQKNGLPFGGFPGTWEF